MPIKKQSTKNAPVKKAPAKKVPVKKVPAKKAPVKKAPAKEVPAKEVINTSYGESDLINLFTNYKISFWGFINDRHYYLEEKGFSEKESKSIINEIGKYEFVFDHSEKDGRNCIVTRIIHFEKYNCFIKEIVTGECNYKDVALDGYPDSFDRFLVEPKELKALDYLHKRKLNLP